MNKQTIRLLANILVVSLAIISWGFVLWTGTYLSERKSK